MVIKVKVLVSYKESLLWSARLLTYLYSHKMLYMHSTSGSPHISHLTIHVHEVEVHNVAIRVLPRLSIYACKKHIHACTLYSVHVQAHVYVYIPYIHGWHTGKSMNMFTIAKPATTSIVLGGRKGHSSVPVPP